jgi:hypothetical protein
MIPDWEKALESAKSLLSADGRLVVADFDTYTEEGKSFKDFLIRTWYAQDGVRIEAKTRQVLTNNVFPSDKFTVTVARFQRTLCGVSIPHHVTCCRKQTATCEKGYRRLSNPDLKELASWEEKKTD